MKKLSLLAAIALLFASCQKDDETLVPINDAPQSSIEQNLTDTTAILEWDDMGATSYRVEYGVSGFNIGEGLVVTTTTTSVTLADLTPETTYDYVVQALFTNRDIITRSIRRFTTRFAPVVTEFRPTLSEMRLFRGNLSNLTPTPYGLIYDLNSRLYTDNAEKQRVIYLPLGTSMTGSGDGLPDFPDNSVVVKTFYYNIDDRDESLGKKIVETRVMIKTNGAWEFGDYVWNESQTEATLDNNGSVTPISYIDMDGMTQNVNYKIPSQEDCFTCHQSYRVGTLIGPKLRSMNFDINGINQLQTFINEGYLTNVPDVATLGQLPSWEDVSLTDEERVRAYLDMNCAHCHSAGGFHNFNYYDALSVDFETSFEDSHILDKRLSIMARMQTSVEGYSMPYIGVTTPDQKALDLVIPYLESLE
ncbi:MAG: fibronectin type III domain-containing protein [Aquaticitalea sp.]